MKEVKEGPFVGKDSVLLFLGVETVVEVVEVVVKVMVGMGEVDVFERRGLPQDEFFLSTFFLRHLPHCAFSSSNSWSFPYLLCFYFSFLTFW